jgi:hypothetical protein
VRNRCAVAADGSGMFAQICIFGAVLAGGLVVARARDARLEPWMSFASAAASAVGALGVTATKYVFAQALFSGDVVDASMKETMLREVYGEYTTFVAIAIVAVLVAGGAFLVSRRTAFSRIGAIAMIAALVAPLGFAASKPYTLHDRMMHEMFAAADVEHADDYDTLDKRCGKLESAVQAAGGIDAARRYEPHVDAMSRRCISSWLDALDRGGKDAEALETRAVVFDGLHPEGTPCASSYALLERSSLLVDDGQRNEVSSRALAASTRSTRRD